MKKERKEARNRLGRARKPPRNTGQDIIHAGSMLRSKESPLRVREIRRLGWDEIRDMQTGSKRKTKGSKEILVDPGYPGW